MHTDILKDHRLQQWLLYPRASHLLLLLSLGKKADANSTVPSLEGSASLSGLGGIQARP